MRPNFSSFSFFLLTVHLLFCGVGKPVCLGDGVACVQSSVSVYKCVLNERNKADDMR